MTTISHWTVIISALFFIACTGPTSSNLTPHVDFPVDEGAPFTVLSLPFADCEGGHADDIEPWTAHPDTGLCSFACVGTTRDKPIEEICANVGGVCKVNQGNNSGFCVQP